MFTTLLNNDKSRTRSTYVEVERSFLARGDIENAEKIRKLMCSHTLEKIVEKQFPEYTFKTKPVNQSYSAWIVHIFREFFIFIKCVAVPPKKAVFDLKFWLSSLWWWIAQRFGYGSPKLLLLGLFLGIAVSIFALFPCDALEQSLAYMEATNNNDPPIAVPSPTFGDKAFVGVRHLFPMLPLDIAENWRASYSNTVCYIPLPQTYSAIRIRTSDLMGLVSIAAWVWWAFALLTVSLKTFRFLGAHDVK